MKNALQGTAPRWWTAIMMTICATLLYRMMQQNDEWAKRTELNSKEIAVMRTAVDRNSEGLGKAADSIGKIDQIARLLEQRLVRLETREEKR